MEEFCQPLHELRATYYFVTLSEAWMAFSVGYSKYIWCNEGRDAEMVHVCEVIYMVKKLNLICGRCLKFRMLFWSSKIFGNVKKLTIFWS